MAAPITNIHRTEKSAEQIQEERLESLQTSIAEHEEALQRMLDITGELESIGAIQALQAMLDAKVEVSKIAVEQANREPIKNLINHAINASASMASIDPSVTERLSNSVKVGIESAELEMIQDNKVGLFDLMKAINDPDVNRAMRFGLSFLRGMGKELGED